jgi:hypothetical protein
MVVGERILHLVRLLKRNDANPVFRSLSVETKLERV